MAATNHEKLVSDREHVLKIADDISKLGVNRHHLSNIEDRTNLAKILVEENNFIDAIRLLDEIKDNKLGIVWDEKVVPHPSREKPTDTVTVIIRDAREVTTDIELLQHDAGEKYAMQILNQIRGAIDLVEQSELIFDDKDTTKKKLMYVAQTAMQNIDQLNSSSVEIFNTQMVSVLEDFGIQDASSKLNFAKEVANFKDEHHHIVTLTTAKDNNGMTYTVTEADIMLNGLTDKQIQQYQDIANGKPVEWFDKMPKYKQDLLRVSASDIARGKKVIPTQLLKDVAGVRNAYQKITAIKSLEEDSSKILSQTLHCGTPATKIKVMSEEKRQEITNENIKQLSSFLGEREKLNLNVLNSKTPANVRNENFIFKQLKESVESQVVDSLSSTDLPINKWRLFGGGKDTKQFQNNLTIIGEGIKDSQNIKNISSYLKHGKSRLGNVIEVLTLGVYQTIETKAKKEIRALNKIDHALSRDLGVAMECRDILDSTILSSKSQNLNLELASKMDVVRNSVKLKNGELNKILPKQAILNIPNDVNFCKSGKDRTGYVQTKNTQIAVAHYLGVNPQSSLGQKNFMLQVAGSHTQEMAGIQGGTIGCHSIKTNPEFALNEEDKIVNGIINQKSSHFNSKIKVKKSSTASSLLGNMKNQLGISSKFESKEDVVKRFNQSFAEIQATKGDVKMYSAGKPSNILDPNYKKLERRLSSMKKALDIRSNLEKNNIVSYGNNEQACLAYNKNVEKEKRRSR